MGSLFFKKTLNSGPCQDANVGSLTHYQFKRIKKRRFAKIDIWSFNVAISKILCGERGAFGKSFAPS